MSQSNPLRDADERSDRHACWLIWPEDVEVRASFVKFCAAVADLDPVLCVPRGEALHILVTCPNEKSVAEDELRGLHVRLHLNDGELPGLKLPTAPLPTALHSLEARYLNHYVANTTVVVPTFGESADRDALSQFARAFPRHRIVGVRAESLTRLGMTFQHFIREDLGFDA